MKICPICNQTYDDDGLNFCLNDGGSLVQKNDDAPPTVFMNQARSTNQNWSEYENNTQWQNQPIANTQPFGVQGQQQYIIQGANQTLATVSLILGILGMLLMCCYGGIPFGVGALITGYLALNNINREPMIYGGRGMAIGGMITGVIGLLCTLVFIIIAIVAN